jgi:hypothetical protein
VESTLAKRVEEWGRKTREELKREAGDYPRWMFHRREPAVIVRNEEQEAALGAEWSRKILPRDPEPTPPAPEDLLMKALDHIRDRLSGLTAPPSPPAPQARSRDLLRDPHTGQYLKDVSVKVAAAYAGIEETSIYRAMRTDRLGYNTVKGTRHPRVDALLQEYKPRD